MRTLLGIVLALLGLLWSMPTAAFVWHKLFDHQEITQTGPAEFTITEVEVSEVIVFGRSFGFWSGCAIMLMPGIALTALGLAVAFSGRRPAEPRT
jgi:hypothetical protein